MGVWDLLHLENQMKKYLELALNPAFDEQQRVKFRELARAARQHFVEHMNFAAHRVHITQRVRSVIAPRVALFPACIVVHIDLVPLQAGSAQKPGVGVVVLVNDLQRQTHRLVVVARKLHQQTVALIQLETPIRRWAQRLQVRAFEVVTRNRFFQLGELAFDTLCVQVVVMK